MLVNSAISKFNVASAVTLFLEMHEVPYKYDVLKHDVHLSGLDLQVKQDFMHCLQIPDAVF
jgi:hypothetical protein